MVGATDHYTERESDHDRQTKGRTTASANDDAWAVAQGDAQANQEGAKALVYTASRKRAE